MCPQLGIITSREPGIAAARSRPRCTGTSASWMPWITVTGIPASSASRRRVSCAVIAAICASVVRMSVASASRISRSSLTRWGERRRVLGA